MKDLLERASKAYYDGEPFLTNEQYDALESMHGQTLSGNGDTPHAYRMYSLNKCYDANNYPINTESCVTTPKLDGAAISLLYIDGKLEVALTRGDGYKGRNITEKVKTLPSVMSGIDMDGVVQVCGEVVCSRDVPNPRNFCSGALNLKDLEAFKQKTDEGFLTFVAYSVQNRPDFSGIEKTYFDDMDFLYREGFYIVTEVSTSIKTDDNIAEVNGVEVLTDGIVFRIDNNVEYNSLGFTSKFPKGAFAFKENAEEVATVLKDVVWQTGKSGKVTPVALLEPVEIGGAMVSKATLNNIDFIKALDLEIGCKVGVVRSGEIIPCIVSRIE